MTQAFGNTGDLLGGSRAHEAGRTTTELAQQSVPRDRVRWGPILAGLFAALSTLAVLTVLGIAIGFSAADYGDSPRAFGIGAGIWTIVSVLVAFFVGGLLSAYAAATPATRVDRDGDLHGDNSLLQGAMVWMVAIPLSIYLIAGGIGSALSVAGKTANAAVQASSNVAGPTAAEAGRQANQDPQAANQASAATQNAAGSASAQVDKARTAVNNAVTPENVDRAANVAASGAWGTLVSLIVGLIASSVGGFVGGKARSTATVRHAAA